MYDLSNNPIKYRIVDYLINSFGENYFTNSIIYYFNINYHYPIILIILIEIDD